MLTVLDTGRLAETVAVLAIGTDPIQERLKIAIERLDEIRAFRAMHGEPRSRALDAIVRGLDGPTIARLSDERASEIAFAITQLYFENLDDAFVVLERTALALEAELERCGEPS
jgi:hypothetical protein